jgi:non-ribosomal peptide synthetase component F
LNWRANHLARTLRTKGVTTETIVGIITKHSIETVIGILGVLKAGGAYLPIDPNYPIERINYMLFDSRVGILLTNLSLDHELKFSGEMID